jgi:Tol biopolymer transport system component
VWWKLGTAEPRLQVRPLTIYPGQENEPSLSPDGNFVAFSWSRPGDAFAADIWIRSVGSEALPRLTETPLVETMPAWSPDGKEIAFARQKHGVFIISQLGWPLQKLHAQANGVSYPQAEPDSVIS